ncbi:MAG: ABC transporter substrate-binding protein [Candidatus Aminicenantes bacterium]|nr:MAG: ABC transporter substrate-binding protein [Candidatus Aminicenantes bacterium]
MDKKPCLITALTFALVLMIVFPLQNFGEKSVETPRYGGVFRVKSFSSTFRIQFDPTHPDSYIFISEQIFNGLVRLDKELNPVPSLAEYWKISADNTRYTFFLRKGVKFHHGDELTAEDVKFSLERLLDKETGSPYYQYFLPRVVGAVDFREGRTEDVAGFKVVDRYTFEIHWTKPYVSTSNLYLMSMHFCKILPRERVIGREKRFFERPSGTGPFAYEHLMQSPFGDFVGIRLKRNNQYFGKRAYLSVIEFSPYFTLEHFLNGECDSMPVASDRLLKPDFQVFQDGLLHPIYLGMSCHIPPLDRQIVRKAIFFGLDKREFARDTFDLRYHREVTNTYIPSRLQGFFPRDDETFNLDEAKQMLQEAGFTDENEFPTLTLFIELPETDLKLRIFRALRKQLEPLGIKLKLNYHRSLEEIKEHENPYLVFIGRVMDFPDPEDIIRPFFFSRSVFNVFGYANLELDRLLLEAEVEPSWTKRNRLFRQIEQVLFDDVPSIPLFSHQNRVVMQAYVKGVEIPPLGFYYLNTGKIWLDK